METSSQELPPNIWKTAAAIGAAGFFSKMLWSYFRGEKKSRIPEKWVNVAQIRKLIIYPVKSCKGLEVESAIVTPLGLKGSKFMRDRAFAVVDSKGVFQTQRQFPTLALIDVQIEGDAVTFSATGVPSITIRMDELEGNSQKYFRIWHDKLKAIDCGDAIGKWLDTFLNHNGLRLAYDFTNEQQRKFTSEGASVKKFPNFTPRDLGIFHDDTAYMLMAKESIAVLNTKIESPVPYKSFRPVILVDGLREPFAEDFWTYIRFSDKEKGPILKNCIPCSRCRVTTVDQSTGVFDENGQPLKTLFTMTRKVGGEEVSELVKKKAVLGANFGLFDGKGLTIKVGDSIYAALL